MQIYRKIRGTTRAWRFYMWILIVMWAATVYGLLLWGISRTTWSIRHLAHQVGKGYFNKDQSFRGRGLENPKNGENVA